MTGVRLVIPAFNEEDRIERCLRAAAAAPLPASCAWLEWVLLDGGSTDATVERAVASVQGQAGAPPLRVVSTERRRGKAGDLGSFHAEMLGRGGADDLVVVVDADAAIETRSLLGLLAPLVRDGGPGVVWGADRPDDHSFGRWASAFQMVVVDAVGRRRGSSSVRAYGRFFAYRSGSLRDFCWQAQDNVDDVQLADHLEGRRIPVLTCWDATVLVTPAGNYVDFCKQTIRFWTASDASAGHGRRHRLGDLVAAGRVATRHPLWAAAYVPARLVALCRHRRGSGAMTATWSPPRSTKRSHPSSGSGPAAVLRPDGPVRRVEQERLVPLVRNPHVTVVNVRARSRAVLLRNDGSWISARPPIFVIGCGRSGTTILGRVLALHPQVHYRYEPNASWAVIDPRTDYLQLYTPGPASTFMDEGFVTASARRRFAATMRPRAGRVLVEKTPINALRLPYLDALAPGARFVHITRNGLEVARSIEEYARKTVRYPGRGPFNTWWGIDDAKWHLLVRDAVAAGYPAEDGLPDRRLLSDQQRGAYEWAVSLSEVDRFRDLLGERLVEVRYTELTGDPERTLRSLAASLGLPVDREWVARGAALVRPARTRASESLCLPADLAAVFNDVQARYSFDCGASVSGSAA